MSGASTPAAPGRFVSIGQAQANPLRWDMSLYSSRSGTLTRRLASFPELSFTNNGLALTPDGKEVYFTLIPRHAGRRFYLRLMRIDVATRGEVQVAEGAQPAVSDDGTQLAYATFPHGLAVRDLTAGTTRTISLVAELGEQADLLDGAVTWLADGSDIAIVPSAPARALVGHHPPRARWCGTTAAHAVVVFVHVPAEPAPLTARCAHVAGKPLSPAIALGANTAAPTSLLIATDSHGDSTQLERIAQTGATTRLLTIRNSLPLAFDSTGNHLMYLVGHRPPRLWEATIADGHLTDRSRLHGHNWGPIAW